MPISYSDPSFQPIFTKRNITFSIQIILLNSPFSAPSFFFFFCADFDGVLTFPPKPIDSPHFGHFGPRGLLPSRTRGKAMRDGWIWGRKTGAIRPPNAFIWDFGRTHRQAHFRSSEYPSAIWLSSTWHSLNNPTKCVFGQRRFGVGQSHRPPKYIPESFLKFVNEKTDYSSPFMPRFCSCRTLKVGE